MHVTIICDASFCDQYKVAGYGYWIACSRNKVGGSGVVNIEVENNNTAEMMAMANTLWHGSELLVIEKGDSILIQTDCTSAIAKLQGKQPCKTEQEKTVYRYFHSTAKKLKLQIAFKHVKGHSGIDDSRSVANKMCDRRAKRAMRLARIEKINQLVVKVDK